MRLGQAPLALIARLSRVGLGVLHKPSHQSPSPNHHCVLVNLDLCPWLCVRQVCVCVCVEETQAKQEATFRKTTACACVFLLCWCGRLLGWGTCSLKASSWDSTFGILMDLPPAAQSGANLVWKFSVCYLYRFSLSSFQSWRAPIGSAIHGVALLLSAAEEGAHKCRVAMSTPLNRLGSQGCLDILNEQIK